MIATVALFLVAGAATIPATIPQQRSGYPKLFRCQSAFQTPVPYPGWSPACLAFRDAERARVAALPVAERIARVKHLRALIGVGAGEGLDIDPSGDIRPARIELSSAN